MALRVADSSPASAGVGASEVTGGSTVIHESVQVQAPGDAKPRHNHNTTDEARRFSRNNPANLEVFGRMSGGVESFDRSAANPEIPGMDSSSKK